MKRRKWSSTEKLQIASGCLRFAPAVLEGLRAAVPMPELCTRHQISQSQYYQWRDRLLQNGSKVFEQGGAETISVTCPRCGAHHHVPRETIEAFLEKQPKS